MKWERSDLVVGSVVVLAVLLLTAGFLWLSPVGSRHAYPIYTEFDRIDGLSRQAQVVLRGYTVGSVGAIEPRMDADRGMRFRVRLDIHARLASGDSLLLPRGTTARLVPPPVIGAGFILLEPPPGAAPALAPGAVIAGISGEPILEQVQGLSTELSGEAVSTMRQARTLLDSVALVVAQTQSVLAQTSAALPGLLAGIERQLEATGALTADLHGRMDTLLPTALALVDSVNLVMADSRRLVEDLHLTLHASAPGIEEILANLDTSTVLLTHFLREISERPLRVLTGVRPPPSLTPPPGAPATQDTVPPDETPTPPGT